MSTRIVRGAFLAVFTFAMALPVVAADGLLHHLVIKDTARRNCWPKPFTCQDIAVTRAPFMVEVMNGWERQNMLASHHFDPSTGQLTEAGKLKVQWILIDAPEQHRTLFVRRDLSPEVTMNRLNTVRAYAGSMMTDGMVPEVAVSSMPDSGTPGERADFVNRKFAAVAPEPKLPCPGAQSEGK